MVKNFLSSYLREIQLLKRSQKFLMVHMDSLLRVQLQMDLANFFVRQFLEMMFFIYLANCFTVAFFSVAKTQH
jgi:hypothetical protein